MNLDIKNLILVNCEVYGKSPSTGMLTEFGKMVGKWCQLWFSKN